MSDKVWDGVREWTYADLAENEAHLRFLIDDHSPDTNSGRTFCPICDRRAPCEIVELASTGLAAMAERDAQAARIVELETAIRSWRHVRAADDGQPCWCLTEHAHHKYGCDEIRNALARARPAGAAMHDRSPRDDERPDETARLVEDAASWCGWIYVDRFGEMYPCDRKSWRRLVDGPELWEGAFCKYHAARALKRAREEQKADAEAVY